MKSLLFSASLFQHSVVWTTGPSPEFSSKGDQKPEGGAKNQKEWHIFKIQYWMYVAIEGLNVKWGGTIFKWGGQGTTAPRWRRPWWTRTSILQPLTCDVVDILNSRPI